MTGTEAAPADLLARGRVDFARAREAAGGSDIDLLVGGRLVRLSFAGDGLRDILQRALAASQISEASSPPALTIRVWDAAGTGVPFDGGGALLGRSGPLGLVETLCDDRFRVVFGPAISIIDLESREAIYHVPDPGLLPYWELAHPARLVFAAWAATVGLQMCHGAAVGEDEDGVLLVGPGGSGKSTVALACLGAGMRCAGDDYVLVGGGSEPVVHSLYASTLLHRDHREQWPALMPRVDNDSEAEADDKAVMFSRPGAISGGFVLRAVVVPRVGARGIEALRAISRARAFRALAPSSILQLGAFDRQALERLSAVCRSLPCAELTLDGAVNAIPDEIRETVRLASTGALTHTGAPSSP